MASYSYLLDILGKPQPDPLPANGRTGRKTAAPTQGYSGRNVSTPTEEQASQTSRAQGDGFYGGGLLNAAGNVFGNPVVNPIGWVAGKAGKYANDSLGFDPVGAVQDPVGTALDYAGAPDAVQAIANPTGYITRTAVNPSTQYGTNVPRIASSGIQGGKNIINDVNNAAGAVKDAVGAVGGYFGDALAPRAQVAGAGGGASQAPAPAAAGITRPDSYRSDQGVQRPDSYRTDDVMSQLQALFASEQRKGPSEAEALLQQATDRAAAQSLGIAAGARGGAGARSRARSQAVAANAAMGSKASSDVAALRAREENDRQARRAQIMGLLSGAAQGADTRDLGYAQADQQGRIAGDNLDLGYTQAQSQADQAAASLANTAYQSEEARALQRAMFNAQQPTGFLDDPVGGLFTRLFGGPLRSGARV